jgi:hypothetical protein
LPAAISVPFLEVASHLGLPPTATYSALNLWNFTATPGSDLSQVDNLSVLQTFTGTIDEAWFYLISVAIEARGAATIPLMLKAMDAVRSDDPQTVAQCLLNFSDTVQEIGAILDRMYDKCDPEIFYHKIRPFLAGSKNMAVAGLPNGVFYEDGNGRGQWRDYSGGSNAQSSLIQFFDVMLGVEHEPTRKSKVVEVDLKVKRGFLAVCILNPFLPHQSLQSYCRKCESTCQAPTAAFSNTSNQRPISEIMSRHRPARKMSLPLTILLLHGLQPFEISIFKLSLDISSCLLEKLLWRSLLG